MPLSLAGQQRVVYAGATLIDGSGGDPIRESRLVVEAGRVVCVSGPEGCPSRPGDGERRLDGQWITPGLIDTHVHLPFAQDSAAIARQQRLRFALGITTVRDAGSLNVEAALRERARADVASHPVPRVVVSARVTQQYAERFGIPVGAALVSHLVGLGVDAIKIKEPSDGELLLVTAAPGAAPLWLEEIRAARAAGTPVFGHTWTGPPPVSFVRLAIAEGIDGITHLTGFVLDAQPPEVLATRPDSTPAVWAWYKGLWLTARAATLDSLQRAMVRQGTWLEPTLATEYYWGRPMPLSPRLAFLGEPRNLRSMLGRPTPAPPQQFVEAWARQSAFVGAFIRAGGMVVSGTDGVRSGPDLHEEIRLIGEAAGSPLAGLLAATRNAAVALARPDLGVLEPGRLADAVIYDADPLGSTLGTLQIGAVMKGGVLFPADTLLAEFRAEFANRTRAVWRGRILRGTKLLGVLLGIGIVLVLLWRRRR